MTPLQQIDFVFLFIKGKINFGYYLSYHSIWYHVERTPESKIKNQILLKEIIQRLIEDGFITEKKEDKTQPFYNITFKGLLFDGYENEKAIIDQQKTISAAQVVRTSEIAELNHKISSRMYYLTWILAIGTSIAAIYYLMEIAKYLGWIPLSFGSLPGK